MAITAPDLRVGRAEIELPLRSFASAASYDAQIAQWRQALDGLELSEEATAAIRQGRAAESGIPAEVLARRRQLMSELTRLTAERSVLPWRTALTADTLPTEVQVVHLAQRWPLSACLASRPSNSV